MTAVMSENRAVENEIRDIKLELARNGVFLKAGKNMVDLVAHIDGTPDRAKVHEQFDPNGNMDGAVDAFWVCAFDEDGQLLHTQAAHLLDLGRRSVADHIAATVRNYHPKAPSVIKSTAQVRPGPKLNRISGRVAYHGEMWLHKSLRDKGTATLVNRLGICMCVREWDPNAIFGLMSWTLACGGFNMRIGYTHSEPLTVEWMKASDLKRHQVWAVYLEREDIQFLLDLPAVEFAETLRRDFR